MPSLSTVTKVMSLLFVLFKTTMMTAKNSMKQRRLNRISQTAMMTTSLKRRQRENAAKRDRPIVFMKVQVFVKAPIRTKYIFRELVYLGL